MENVPDSHLSRQILKITADGNSAIFQSSVIPRVGEFLILLILFFTAVTRLIFPHPLLNCFYPTSCFALTFLELHLFISDNFLHYQDHFEF